MVEYKIVKFCRLCNARFVVEKGQRRRIYCDACQKKIERGRAKEEKEAKK